MKCVDGCPMVKAGGSVFRAAAPAAIVIQVARVGICSRCGDVFPTVKSWRHLARISRDMRLHNRVAAKRRMLREDRKRESNTD
jgi:hypothetical protein